MSRSSAVVVQPRSFATSFAPALRRAAGVLGFAAASAGVASAQSAATTVAPSSPTWELRFTSGALVATGAQRDAVKDGQLSAVQLSWLVHPAIAITGTAGWARSRDRLVANTPKLDVFTGDLGAEFRPAQWFTDHKVSMSPFVGAGAGVRSYNYRKLEVDATHNVAGYLAAGGELGMGRVGLRLEVRDYATGFKPLVGAGSSDTRNDVMLMAGVRFNRHRTARQ
jgi:hypothetical protein